MKREATNVIDACQRKRILRALSEHELTTLEIATDLEIESSLVIRIIHDMCLQRLIKMKPISANLKKRYKETHDVLLDVMAAKRPVKDLEAYNDCTPRPYVITKAGRTYLNA